MRLVRQIYQREGGMPGFYRGLTSNLVGNSLSWACFFFCYEHTKAFCAGPKRSLSQLTLLDYLLASGTAGAITAVASNPVWVIKTRMLSTPVARAEAYQSLSHGVQRLFREEGIRGFYAGLVPSLIGICHGILQFTAYEEMKKLNSIRKRDEASYSRGIDYLVFGGLSKLFSGTITFPYQVVRTRLQTHGARKQYDGISGVLRTTWKDSGVRGFYRGLLPYLARVLPSSAVTFLVYESTKSLISSDL